MKNLTVKSIYGAKCTSLNDLLFILTRTRSQMDSKIIFDLISPKKEIGFLIKNSHNKNVDIDIYAKTLDGNNIKAGKLTNKESSLYIHTTSLITNLQFIIKNSGMLQNQITLQGITP